MTFWKIFVRLLPRRPRAALIALYWHATRRRVRARNYLLAAIADQKFAYDLWIRAVENTSAQIDEFQAAMSSWRFRPRFSILLYSPPGSSSEQAKCSISSIHRQIYSNWSLVQIESESINLAISKADGSHLILLRAGNMLSDVALFRIAEALQSNRSPDVLYGDEDLFDPRVGRLRPWFKPRWNAELFLAKDYLANTAAIELGLAREIASRNQHLNLASLLLLATVSPNRTIIHVPYILCHVATAANEESDRLAAVSEIVHALGATCSAGAFDTVKIEWPLPADLPLVSIIIPTRDKLELLRRSVETVLELTTYEDFEILIVDNGSVELQTHKYLTEIGRSPKVRILAYPGPYNFSAINNFAAREARGAYLCLLNNDTEVVEPDWLTEMMRYAVRPDIGAVGAKLLYDDGSIQHAGVVIGIGGAAGHAHRFLPANKLGYFGMAHVPHFISAVTAACMLVEKRKFEAVDGFDEEKLAVAFNDVDICLKLEAAGWRNVYVPHAVLIHHESKSRGRDTAPEHIDRYRRELAVLQERWGTKTYDDPLHNPNLDRCSETYAFRL